jgi:proton-dependent oligopeptide transporter, POT family
LRDNFGYATAFQFPAWLMVGSLIIFAAGKRYYALEKLEHQPMTPSERRDQWKTLMRLFGVFGMMVFFWVAYEHNDSLWVFFARDYVNLSLPFELPLIGKSVAPDQVQFLNPLFVVTSIPVFTWLFKKLDPEVRIFTATRKILSGFILTAVAAGVMSAAGYLTQTTGARVSVLWLVVAYIVLTLGEVLLYGTGLELSYTAAPKHMKGFVTACFLLTITLGNFINTWLSQLYGGSLKDAPEDRGPLLPGPFFGMTALIVVGASIGFYFVGRRFDRGSANSAAVNGTT